MIRSAQRKFVIISSSILLVLFLIVFASTTIMLYNGVTKSIISNLKDVEILLNLDNHATPPHDGLYAEFTVSANNDVNVYHLIYDNDSYKGISPNGLINQAYSNIDNVTAGKIDNVYYKIVLSESYYKIYAVDATSLINGLNVNIRQSLFAYLILFGIFIFLIYFYSFRVLKPIVDNTEKQKRFISDASHELKTPLSIINASADVLENDATNSKWIQNIKNQTARMDVLVQDMLALSKLEEGSTALIKEEFNLSEEITNNVLPFEAITFENNKKISYEIQDNIIVKTDRNSVKKLVNILLDNAVKYASDGGEIVVRLVKQKGKIIFAVHNSGSEVPDKDSAKVFERFYRADPSRSRDCGGSGLGLAIAKNLAVTNKWKIYANSIYGVSMTITVLF